MKAHVAAALFLSMSILVVVANALEYGAQGTMVLPKDYREWVFLSSGVGMSYTESTTPNPNPGFDNVFVNPDAYKAYLKTGTWPDKTVLILEVRASDSKVSINKNGRVQTNVVGIEAHVKDASHGGWAFYSFGNGTQTQGTLFPKTANCYSCHEQSAAVDTTFVQFYPTLIAAAKANGTYHETEAAAAPAPAPASAAKRYVLNGVVKSVDANQRTLVVQHDEIPGFMAAMTMSYKVGSAANLPNLVPGDQIHADVVVNPDEMHLENISVVGPAKSPNNP